MDAAARAALCAENRAQIARYLNYSSYLTGWNPDRRWEPSKLIEHLINYMRGILFPGSAPQDPLILAAFNRFLRSAKFLSEGRVDREMKILHAKTYDAFGMTPDEFASHLLKNYP
jgi:hypothetical protein